MKKLLAALAALFGTCCGRTDAPPEGQKPVERVEVRSRAFEGALSRDDFWAVIGAANGASGGDPERKEEALRQVLVSLSAEQVSDYARHWEELNAEAYSWDLWAAAYTIHGGCSDDTFQDFRASLICQGRERFEAAMADPDSLAEVDFTDVYGQLFFEGYQYLRWEVYEEKTGEKLPRFEGIGRRDPSGEDWEDEDLPKRVPKLWAKFGE